MQNDLVENCRKWITNFQDANHAVNTIGKEIQLLSLSREELIAFDVEVELNCKFKDEVMPYCRKAALIDSEIEAKLANVSAEIRMLVRAWMEQNWESRYSSWGPLFAILMEDGTTPAIQKAMSGKPALSALFDRLGYLRWETIDESDERNLQRLSEILLIHRIEIERPRGERKARLKKLPS